MESPGNYPVSLYELEAGERNLQPRVRIDNSELHVNDSFVAVTASGTYKFDCLAEHEDGPLVLMCSLSEVKEAIGLECGLEGARLELGTRLRIKRPIGTKREMNKSPLTVLPNGRTFKRAVPYLHTTAPILQLFGPFPDTVSSYQLAREFPSIFTFDPVAGSPHDPFFVEAGQRKEAH